MMIGSRRSTLLLSSALAALTMFWLGGAARADDQTYQFDIPSEPLGQALTDFSRASSLQIVFSEEATRGRATNGLHGRYTAARALTLLLAGSDLQVETNSSGVVMVRSKNAVAASSEGAAPADSNGVETVVVTGSRLPQTGAGPQDVKTYTQERIERSGQTTVADFLSTIPSASVATGESGLQTAGGATTVQLHGLPFGTTLVLLNGRRVETSGAQGFSDFFDLNNIPLAAVDRIEVLANGSSAIYGSDAIAGVVNVILRKDFDGVQASVTYGGASGIDEADANLAWGKEWDKGSVSIIGSYQTRGELTASERSITSSLDFTRFGGPNNNFPECSPGNVYSIDGITPLPGLGTATFAAVPAGFHGTPSIQEFSATAGIQNECNLLASESLIPATRRFGVFAQANYEITPSIELFAELMYSHVQQYNEANYQGLFGEPFFQFFTVSASNPYNPFGTAVGVSDLFTSLPREGTISGTNFVRPLVGARGSFLDSWHWELSAWESADFDKQTNPLLNADNAAIQNALNSSNPATALNPFVAGPSDAQQQQLISSFFTDGHSTYLGREQSINGFVRGPLFSLPSGPVEVVLGGEYDRGTLMQDNIDLYYLPPNSRATYHRDSYALFGEARIPLIANHSDPDAGDVLAVTIAGRHDHFDDFGSADTPQVGAEWRPWDELLVRATYSDAFKAPTLFQLHTPQSASTGIGVVDPTTGQSVSVTVIGGGNPNLRAETGRSYTYGFVYSSKLIPNLRLSITHWNVDENDSIQNLSPQFIVNNESLFRGDVIRNSAGMITQVNDTFVNFGQIDVAGLDYELSYLYQSEVGDWSPSVDFTQTYQYSAALVPGSAPTQRAGKASDDGAWAPRWKGTVGLGWKLGPFSANLDGRYVGSYQDYDSTRIIGNFWFFDGSLRYAIGKVLSPDNQNTSGVYVQIGGVNLFNELPQFSNYQSDFVGYDPTQADIRGRFLYVQIGTNL